MSGGTTAFLFGAGASCKALPIGPGLYEDLGRFRSNYEQVADLYVAGGRATPQEKTDWHTHKEGFFSAIDWVTPIARDYISFDAFAVERTFLGDVDAVRKLKATVSSYFVAKQAMVPIDPRYRTFLAEILERRTVGAQPTIPSDMRIVTWNYDTQIEAAYSSFLPPGSNEVILEQITFNEDQIVRLNGYCGAILDEGHGPEFAAPWTHRGDAMGGALVFRKQRVTYCAYCDILAT